MFKRINCLVCDLILVYALFYLLLFIRPIGFPINVSYFCSVILYFGLSYGLFRYSWMQKIFGFEIKKRRLNYFLFKLLWIAIVPLALSIFHYEIYLILYVLAIPILSIILLPFTKKSLWQWCSGAQIELQKIYCKNKSSVVILFVTTIVLLLLPWFSLSPFLKIDDILRLKNKVACYPISIPEKICYVKNIKQYKQNPVDYVLQLFDKYDIVIFCERWHSEYTQWEFFSDVILNDAFAGKVQNVFTELGHVDNQDILDSYMQTHFSTEEELQKATARIIRENGGGWPVWNNTNIYDFLLHLHRFNETRDSLSRINYFFTDIPVNWEEIKTPIQYDSIWAHRSDRDSIMAYNVINQYNKLENKKCLLITNTRHAWKYGKMEANYIFEKFPDKTAIVLINGTTQFLCPVMNATLDAAALEIPDSIWAIDFNNCPLGNTQLDLYPISYKLNNLTYKDLFVGMVYCKHPRDWIKSDNYPFMMDNYKDTLLNRSALVGEDYLKNIQRSIDTGYFDAIRKEETPFPILINNLVFLSVHCLLLLFLFLNLLVLLLKKQKTEQL